MQRVPLFLLFNCNSSKIEFLGDVLVSLFNEVELRDNHHNIQRDSKHIRYVLSQTAVHTFACLALVHDRRNLSEPIAIEQHLCYDIRVGIIGVEIIIERVGRECSSAEAL